MEDYTRKEVSIIGSIYYFNSKGDYHRLGGAAVERADSYKEWWINGRLHRIDGPAAIWKSGYKEWWANGQIYLKHRHNRLALFSILEPQRVDINPTEE